MTHKVFRFYGLNAAMELLRPGAKWEISNRIITRWDDPRPCPTWEEIDETMEKIRQFEESINTVWLPEDLAKITEQMEVIDKAMA